jgi:hypothetical protein
VTGFKSPTHTWLAALAQQAGGSTASFKYRRIFFMALAFVIAAMIRSVSC